MTHAGTFQVLLLKYVVPSNLGARQSGDHLGAVMVNYFAMFCKKIVPYFEISEKEKKLGGDWKHELAD